MIEPDKNDELLNQFFKENKKEIEDFGFSRRVIRRLPGHEKMLVNLWIGFCSLVATVLFFMFDGLHALMSLFEQLTVAFMSSKIMTTDPLYLLLALGVLITVGVKRLCSV